MDPRPELVNHYTGGSNIYEIPVFQRNYQWDKDKWIYLWNDIRDLYNLAKSNMSKNPSLNDENALDKKTHFIGTILSRAITPLGGGMGQKYSIIDGQQRLLTIFIILAAIRDDEIGPLKKVPVNDPLSYLSGRDKKFLRLSVNRSDSQVFKKILSGECKDGLLSTDVSSKPGQAYLFFRWQLWKGQYAKQESEEDLNELVPPRPGKKKNSPQVGDFLKYWSIEEKGTPYNLQLLQNCINYGLSILEIILGPEDEEDAIVFETINARGTELEKFDLVKNSFFLRLGDRAESFFDQKWNTFENRLTNIERPKGSKGKIKDQFIYDYLVFLGLDKVTGKKLYPKWLQYVREQLGSLVEGNDGSSFEEVVAKPMLNTSLLYPAAWGASTTVNLLNKSLKLPAVTHKLISDTLQLTSGPTIPIHMLGLDAWLREKITADELAIWFRKIQGFVLRMVLANENLNNIRALILASTTNLVKNPTLDKLSELLKEGVKNSNIHLKSLIKTSAFATNENSKAVRLILQGIERQIQKENAHPMESGAGSSKWEVEHIYPQSESGPGPAWRRDIKEWKLEINNYEPLKYTLGNITALTSPGNLDASRKPFKVKKGIYKDTRLGLQDDLLKLKFWRPKEIQDRGSLLLTYFIQEWPEK